MAKQPDQQDLQAVRKDRLQRPPLEDIDDMCRAVLARIDRDKQRLQPTPMKGDIVGWCRQYAQRADKQVIWDAAVVVDCLDPGRLTLEVFTGGGQHVIAASAVYIHHPENLKDANVKIGTGGGWFYREVMADADYQPDKAAFAWHVQKLFTQEQAALADLKTRQAAEMERLERIRRMKAQPQEAATA
jgi:hypothetical protein